MLTDDQFERLLVKISRANEDHDLLNQIKTTTDLTLKFQKESFEKHLAEDAKDFGEIKGKVAAVHKRLDNIFSLKDRLLGGAAALSSTIALLLALFSIFHTK